MSPELHKPLELLADQLAECARVAQEVRDDTDIRFMRYWRRFFALAKDLDDLLEAWTSVRGWTPAEAGKKGGRAG